MRFNTASRNVNLGTALALFVLLMAFAAEARAVTIPWSTVGNPGNAVDSVTGSFYGAVPYAYRIGTYEVTNNQYAEFLNAVAATDSYGLYNFYMGYSVVGGITQNGSPGSYSYGIKPGYANLPVNLVSWGDAARFANWLSNGQPTGPQNALTTENGSYFLNGAIARFDLAAVTRSAGATVVIPTENEWYKAAYYNPATHSYFQYPTSSNTAPSNTFIDAGNNANFRDYSNNSFTTGSPYLTDVGHFALSESPYGTFDQGGNVFEWNETLNSGAYRVIRGGGYGFEVGYLLASNPQLVDLSSEWEGMGFRVALVPEPSSGVLAALGFLALWWWRKRFR